MAETEEVLTSVDIADLITKYSDDLPAHESLDTELHCWSIMWCRRPEDAATLNTPAKVLQSIDRDFFPNLDVLFKIACTLAVTSAAYAHRPYETILYPSPPPFFLYLPLLHSTKTIPSVVCHCSLNWQSIGFLVADVRADHEHENVSNLFASESSCPSTDLF